MIDDIITYGRNILKGKFTYTVALWSIVWALCGLLLGNIELAQAMQIISTSLLAVGIRRGVSNDKSENKMIINHLHTNE